VVPLFVAHGEVVASIDPAPPSADRVVCGGRTEAGDPLFGRRVEEEAKDAFFGRILQSERTANRRLGLPVQPGQSKSPRRTPQRER